MKNLSKEVKKMGASLARLSAACTANSTCVFIVHQPKVPEAVKRLKRGHGI